MYLLYMYVPVIQFTDTDVTVRTNAHLAIEMCSRTHEGTCTYIYMYFLNDFIVRTCTYVHVRVYTVHAHTMYMMLSEMQKERKKERKKDT